ncbi:uncharacterized protein EV422DRAFT_231418 [Fimicolochytrium jonesii]|uniref:uncharacterized protein n=1 Tax=Fimicolochytrium jonesii TaxID=1396493 RepID=UPI0022FED282|nr:uncharacterized protein EV422DRAFT_231418 [Fimicolochytrium jonesii]KAI8817296.1 hypothetical protein EV422DRAFT_231418 [Fimicolochytrium jonesii]
MWSRVFGLAILEQVGLGTHLHPLLTVYCMQSRLVLPGHDASNSPAKESSSKPSSTFFHQQHFAISESLLPFAYIRKKRARKNYLTKRNDTQMRRE